MNHPAASPSWVPASPCTPEVCLRDAVRAVGLVRRVLRCLACVAVVVAGVALSSGVARMRPPVRDALVRAWARTTLRALGVRVRVLDGDEPGLGVGAGDVHPETGATATLSGTPAAAKAARPALLRHGRREGGTCNSRPQPPGELLVANHISWLDIAVLAIVRPSRMVAKREVGQWPVLGRFVARGGTVFVARDRPRALPGDVAAIAAALRTGASVGVFPEGSTWCGVRQGTFRRAVFQAALDAGAAVRPVLLGYVRSDGATAREAAFVGEDTLASSMWRVAGVRGIVAETRVLRAIAPGECRDRRELATAAQEMLATAGRPEPGPPEHGNPERGNPSHSNPSHSNPSHSNPKSGHSGDRLPRVGAPGHRERTTYRAAPVHQHGAARGVPS
ncbi:lysophospholipid acyltransferase family protein [Yinghuangia sp. YIM S09857]|uniref:lysophospholipid acyltransferase family protein n=1 Tax=Yinghuangia sp. YIM S09857 TaxID=3436929 RepID=UPI003F5294C1